MEFEKATNFFHLCFCGEAAKKTSIDGLKWRDLVMGRWWLVNFNVSAVRCHKGFYVLNSARRSVSMIGSNTRTAYSPAKLF